MDVQTAIDRIKKRVVYRIQAKDKEKVKQLPSCLLTENDVDMNIVGVVNLLGRNSSNRKSKLYKFTTTVLNLSMLNLLNIRNLETFVNLVELNLSMNKITVLEHLDHLVALRKLDLRYNQIKKIQGLETLKNMRVLNLKKNQIQVIEGIDSMKMLQVFNIAYNNIKGFESLTYMRQFKQVIQLNIEGNPVCCKEGAHSYALAMSPQVRYYNNFAVSEKEREDALEKFKYEIQTERLDGLLAARNKEKDIKELKIRDEKSNAFVIALEGDYLFNEQFENDPDGQEILMLCTIKTKLGNGVTELYEKFKSDFREVTRKLYDYGVNKHRIRKNERYEFEKAFHGLRTKRHEGFKELMDKCWEKKVNLIKKIGDVVTEVEMSGIQFTHIINMSDLESDSSQDDSSVNSGFKVSSEEDLYKQCQSSSTDSEELEDSSNLVKKTIVKEIPKSFEHLQLSGFENDLVVEITRQLMNIKKIKHPHVVTKETLKLYGDITKDIKQGIEEEKANRNIYIDKSLRILLSEINRKYQRKSIWLPFSSKKKKIAAIKRLQKKRSLTILTASGYHLESDMEPPLEESRQTVLTFTDESINENSDESINENSFLELDFEQEEVEEEEDHAYEEEAMRLKITSEEMQRYLPLMDIQHEAHQLFDYFDSVAKSIYFKEYRLHRNLKRFLKIFKENSHDNDFDFIVEAVTNFENLRKLATTYNSELSELLRNANKHLSSSKKDVYKKYPFIYTILTDEEELYDALMNSFGEAMDVLYTEEDEITDGLTGYLEKLVDKLMEEELMRHKMMFLKVQNYLDSFKQDVNHALNVIVPPALNIMK